MKIGAVKKKPKMKNTRVQLKTLKPLTLEMYAIIPGVQSMALPSIILSPVQSQTVVLNSLSSLRYIITSA